MIIIKVTLRILLIHNSTKMTTDIQLVQVMDLITRIELDPSFKSISPMDSRMMYLTSRCISLAEELKKKQELYLSDLKKNGPKVFFEHCDPTFILMRDGKEKRHTFPDCHVEICFSKDEKILALYKLEGSPDEDGYIYFIRAISNYIDAIYAVYLSKKEAIILKKRLHDAELEYYKDA